LIQVDPARAEEVKSAMRGAGVTIITQVFDYVTIDIPEELVPKVRAIPGVVEVTRETPVKIMAMPVFEKLQKFMELATNPFTLPEALNFSLMETADRWPTIDSRRVLGAEEAEAEGYLGKGVKVAVIDTGLDLFLNPQLPPTLYGVSSVEGQPGWLDDNGHGTHVATTIAGREFPSPWGSMKGVAPEAEVGIFKCLGYGIGTGTNTSVIRAMADAFAWGADIISMSLGGSECEDYKTCPNCRIVKALTEQGVICVIAAGNEGPKPMTLGCPGSAPDALTVAAMNRDGTIADFSSRGPSKDGRVKPDTCAPGVYILSTTCGMIALMQFMDGFKLGAISGTSMATPHVSGLVALIKQLYRESEVELTTSMLKDMLERYGEPKSNERGWGILTWSMARKYLEEVLGRRA